MIKKRQRNKIVGIILIASLFFCLFQSNVKAVQFQSNDIESEQVKNHPLIALDTPIFPNPLKGFMWMQGDANTPPTNGFQHSLEYVRLPVNAIVNQLDDAKKELVCDWSVLENALNGAKHRGANVVLRFYMSQPDSSNAIPQYLVDLGYVDKESTNWDNVVKKLKKPNDFPDDALGMTRDEAINKLLDFSTAGAVVVSKSEIHPNYLNEDVQYFVKKFAAALGDQYDGDERIAAIEAGLLGPWGEWIVSTPYDIVPTTEYLKKDKSAITYSLYARLMDVYNEHFSKTHIQLREWHSLRSTDTKFGFHNDTFGIGSRTAETSSFAARVSALGKNKWKEHPIGGELGPEFQYTGFSLSGTPNINDRWLSFFDVSNGKVPKEYLIPQNASYVHANGEGGKIDFQRDAQQEHTSWLLVRRSAFYNNEVYPTLNNAIEASSMLGYDLAVTNSYYQDELTAGEDIFIGATIQNRGIAPFYYNWPITVSIYDESNQQIIMHRPDWNITEVGAAGETNSAVTYSTTIQNNLLSPGKYYIRMQIPNPMENGLPLVMANEESIKEDGSYTGWIELGSFIVKNNNFSDYIDYYEGNVPIPMGFIYVDGTEDLGLIVEDENENQFVWVPVSENHPCLQETAPATEEFRKMLTSVRKYGGFYVGRYETGDLWGGSTSIVVKPGNTQTGGVSWQVVYNKSALLYPESASVVGSMIWNEQWDVLMEWIEPSENLGNYKDSTFYYKDKSGNILLKNAGKENYLPSGAYENAVNKNIYDLSGNVWEMTIKANGVDMTRRGGGYKHMVTTAPCNASVDIHANASGVDVGSRMQMYIKTD